MLTKPLCLLSDYPKIAFFFSVWILIMISYGGYCLSCRLVCGCVRKRSVCDFLSSGCVTTRNAVRLVSVPWDSCVRLTSNWQIPVAWLLEKYLGSKVVFTLDQENTIEFSHRTYLYFLKEK